MKRHFLRTITFLALITLAEGVTPVVAQIYHITEIPTIGGAPGGSAGYAINSFGQVTGTASTAANMAGDAFIYDAGQMTDLGTLGGYQATGLGINDSGEVVGRIEDIYTQAWAYGFVYVNGQMTALSTVTGQLENTLAQANAVSNSGLVVGNGGDEGVGVFYINQVMHIIAPGAGSANAVNDYGEIAGDTYIYYNGIYSPLALANSPSIAGINNAGQVVGYYTGSSPFPPPFLYTNGTTQNLPQLTGAVASIVAGINNADEIVGSAVINQTYRPFLYYNGRVTDLNTLVDPTDALAPYVTLQEATAINDSGWIVANGVDSRGGNFAYLLTPETPYPPFVQVLAQTTPAETGSPFTVAWIDQSVTACAASGGGSADGWAGTALSTRGGQQQVTENEAGDLTFTITCDGANGAVSSSRKVTVVAAPAVQLTAAPSSVISGEPFALTWSSVTVTSCTGSGGSATDGWNASHPVSGSVTLSESTPAVYTYALTCTYGSQTVSAKAEVTVSAPPPKGGGGDLDPLSLLALLMLYVLGWRHPLQQGGEE